jgi:hypothetical protein
MYKKNIIIITGLIWMAVSGASGSPWNSPYPAPPVTPPAHEHPRLMFRAADMPEITAGTATAEEAAAVREWMQNPAQPEAPASFTARKGKSYRFDGTVLARIENAAFRFAVYKDPAFAAYAYESLIRCFETMKLDGIYDAYRPAGQMVFTAAEVYDWCYAALSDSQKKNIIAHALTAGSLMQTGCPPAKQGAVTGHGSEAQLLRNYLAFAIAVFDERPDIWNFTAGRFYAQYVPVRLFYYQSGMPNFQGSNYGPYRSLFDLWAALLITRAGCPDPFDGAIPRWDDAFLYYERPDGQMWRTGDDTGERHAPYAVSTYAVNAFYASALTGNSAVKGYAARVLGNFSRFPSNSSGESDDTLTPVQFIICNNPSVPADTPEKLPLVRYNGSPLGEYFARGSWTDSGTPAVHMKIGEINSGNHEHRDGGTFELFCDGILASDSGYYTSGGGAAGYTAAEVQTYLHGTIAHNCLLVEPAAVTENDYGGQKTVAESPTLESWLASKDAVRGAVTGHESTVTKDGTGVVYLAGELTNAYEHAHYVSRAMLAVFTGNKALPLLFFVSDRIIPEPGAAGVFLLHMQQEPVVRNGLITITNKNGTRLCGTVLLPASPAITVTGGTGRQYSIAGKNFEPAVTIPAASVAEPGWGRIEIRAPEAAGMTQFLNVFAVVPPGAAAPGSLLLQGTNYEGAAAGPYAVFFAASAIEDDLELTMPEPAADERTVWVCNLAGGKWELTMNDTTNVLTVSETGRMLSFKTSGAKTVTLHRRSGEDE